MNSTLSVTQKPLHHAHLYFTLCTPLTKSDKKESKVFSILFDNFISSPKIQEEFYLKFINRIEEINLLLAEIYSNKINSLTRKIYFSLLPGKITTCLNDFITHTSKAQINLECAQKIYQLSLELNKHESDRHLLWNSLSKTHQGFLQKLFPFSEDLSILTKPIYFQWLGDVGIERARKNDETITNFGDGILFRVSPPSVLEEGDGVFQLSKHPDFQIVKRSSDRRQISHIDLMTSSKTLNMKAMGRISEVFDIQFLESEIKKGGEESIRYINQLLDLFSCYRAGLCGALNLSVEFPIAIGRRGEWTIWPNTKKELLKNIPLSKPLIEDLHSLFHFEKIWKIDIFHLSANKTLPTLTVSEGRIHVDGVLSLPSFLRQNIEERHQNLLERLRLEFDSSHQELWDRLEADSLLQQNRMTNHIHLLKILLDKQSLSSQDLLNLHPQALLVVRVIRLFDQESLLKSPLTIALLIDKAETMLSILLPSSSPSSYTYEQSMNQQGMQNTNKLLSLKKELKSLMLQYIIERFEKKESIEEFVQSQLKITQEICQDIVNQLNLKLASTWPFSEKEGKPGEHFMLLLGSELLEELEKFLGHSVEGQERMYDKLLLLRVLVDLPNEDLQITQNINSTLHSILHEAMVSKYAQLFLEKINNVILKQI